MGIIYFFKQASLNIIANYSLVYMYKNVSINLSYHFKVHFLIFEGPLLKNAHN